MATRTPTRWFNRDLPDVFSWIDAMAPVGREIRVEEEFGDHEMIIRAEAPGIDPEKDAEITVDRGMVRIKVERRQETKEEQEGRVRSEFRYGSFMRAVPLPEGCSETDVKASYRDGILEVRVPVAEPKVNPATKVAITKG